MGVLERIHEGVIVSSQAMPGEPFYDEQCMIAMMQSVVNGGACALRVAGARDVKNAKNLFGIPVIGLTKPAVLPENWKSVVYITPTLKDVEDLINAGADIIAFDGTTRKRNEKLEDFISLIHKANRLAMADISTFEEGLHCSNLGCDIISTTLSGYTEESDFGLKSPDFELLKKLVDNIQTPIILEGRILAVEDVQKAFAIGAYSVVIGSAITRPQLITQNFVNYKENI